MAKVLLVEDDNNLREIYEARLQAEGYDIVSAMNGEEALVVAKKERPDLIISDVMMPRISGFEMLDILRNTEGMQELKVIMLTALGQAEDKTRADALGADRYLVKSQVTLEDIVKAVKELLTPAESAPVAAAAPATSEQGDSPAPTMPEPVAPAPANDTPAVSDTDMSTPVAAAMPVQPAPEPMAAAPAPTIPVVEPPQPVSMPSAAPTDIPVTNNSTDDNATAAVPVAPVEPSMPPATSFAGSTAFQTATQQPAPAPDNQAQDTSAPTPTDTPEPATAEQPQPAPETTPTQSAEPTSDTPEGEVAASHPQSMSAEQATVQEQINNFVQQPVPQPVEAPQPTAGPAAAPAQPPMPPTASVGSPEPASTPQAEAAPVVNEPVTEPAATAPVQPAPTNEQAPHIVMEDTLKDLIANTQLPGTPTAEPASAASQPTAEPAAAPAEPTTVQPVQPAPEPAVPAPQVDQSTGESATASHKKIIAPISTPDANQPEDLASLLAKEGITNMDEEPNHPYGLPPQPAAAPTATPTPFVPPQPAAVPPVGQSPMPPATPQPQPAMPPQAPAAGPMPAGPHQPGHVISPNEDPNRIAL